MTRVVTKSQEIQMIRSMTGYGRAEGSYKDCTFVVELRSVNHRYCDVVVRLPRFLVSLEDTFKKRVQGRFSRGRFELNVTIQRPNDAKRRHRLDLETAESYSLLLTQLKQRLHLSGEIDIALLSQFRDIITVAEPDETTALLEKRLDKTLGRAIVALEKMRKNEGKALAADLVEQLESILGRLSLVKTKEKGAVAYYHKRLQTRVSELARGVKVDPLRLAQEVAIFAERSDISEERTRLNAHVGQFRRMLRKEEAVGRALEFLLQEMNREVNTLSSKSNDLSISMQVVAMKSVLEKMREQVQNIE